MASNTKEDEALELLWNAHFKELKDMSDADILEGADIPKLRTDRIQMMANVKSEAGRRRLAAAKEQLATPATEPSGVGVTVEEARAFLREAANDPRITMAARAFDDMTDDVVLRTYARVKAWLSQNPL